MNRILQISNLILWIILMFTLGVEYMIVKIHAINFDILKKLHIIVKICQKLFGFSPSLSLLPKDRAILSVLSISKEVLFLSLPEIWSERGSFDQLEPLPVFLPASQLDLQKVFPQIFPDGIHHCVCFPRLK